MSDFTLFKKYDLQTSSITAISYSPDSMKLAVGSKDKMFQIVDVNTGMPVFSKMLNSAICSLKWSKFLLVLGCENGVLSIWDMFEVKLILELNAHAGKYNGLQKHLSLPEFYLLLFNIFIFFLKLVMLICNT